MTTTLLPPLLPLPCLVIQNRKRLSVLLNPHCVCRHWTVRLSQVSAECSFAQRRLQRCVRLDTVTGPIERRKLGANVGDQSLSSVYFCDILHRYRRWNALFKSFYNSKKNTYDISKVTDLADQLKFDLVHNSSLRIIQRVLWNMWLICKPIARYVSSCQYVDRVLQCVFVTFCAGTASPPSNASP